jgi:hypothetical protein
MTGGFRRAESQDRRPYKYPHPRIINPSNFCIFGGIDAFSLAILLVHVASEKVGHLGSSKLPRLSVQFPPPLQKKKPSMRPPTSVPMHHLC